MNDHSSSVRQPRVLLCITRLGLGGAEQVALTLLELLQQRITFAVFTAYSTIDDEIGVRMRNQLTASGVRWFHGSRWPVKRGGLLLAGLALGRAIREFQPDCLHYHAEIAEACGATMLQLNPTLARVAALRTVHNSNYWRFWPRIGRWTDRKLAGATVVSVSTAAQTEFVRYRTDSGMAPQLVPAVIPNGVNLPALPPRTASLNPKRISLMFAGRFEEQKGPDILAQSLPQVSLPPNCDADLVCYGHGAFEPLLRNLATHPPPRWTVHVEPPSPRIVEEMKSFDVLLMPSRFEGLPLLAIEASLSGLPVVATDAPGLREALPSAHPWKAPPGDSAAFARAIEQAVREPHTWAPAVRAAQELARVRFSPAAMSEAYFELYSRCVRRA